MVRKNGPVLQSSFIYISRFLMAREREYENDGERSLTTAFAGV